MSLSKTSLEVIKIMRSSKLFQPININFKQNEHHIKQSLMCKSQKLMLDMGIIRHSNHGLYHLLPLGVRSLNKLKNLVRKHLSQIEAQEIEMPLIVDGELWKRSGRWETVQEIFKFKDYHKNDFMMSPTNEESVTELVASLGGPSYRQLPIVLYQIATKFRDEIRPRGGLIRAKEFQMMDAYSFDKNLETAQHTYHCISKIFENIFSNLEIPVVKVLADPGNMGGELSHEYHIISDFGEDTFSICEKCGNGVNIEIQSDSCPSCGNNSLNQVKGIEIGHTFLLGTRYTTPLQCVFKDHDDKLKPLTMASYGIGLSRLLAASLEILSTDEEITWPPCLAPFQVCIIPPKGGSKEWEAGSVLSLEICKELAKILPEDVLLDDRNDQTIGKRLRQAKMTGYPYIICIGKRALETTPLFELYSSIDKTVQFLSLPEVLKYLEDIHQERFAPQMRLA